MQKQSGNRIKKIASRISLDPEFPIYGSGMEPEGISDEPIDFLHQHDCVEIGYIWDGSGLFFIGGDVLRFRTGDVIILPPDVLHRAQSTRNTVSHASWIYFDAPRLLTSVSGDVDQLLVGLGELGAHRIVSERTHPDIAELVRAVIREYARKQDGYRSCVRHLLAAILTCLNRLVSSRARGAAKREKTRKSTIIRLAPALSIMAREYARDMSCSRLAKACFESQTNFRRLFRRAFSTSPKDYLTHLRIQAAAAMLEHTDRRILDIALDSGFQSLSSFNRHFKRIMGTQPREWRKKVS